MATYSKGIRIQAVEYLLIQMMYFATANKVSSRRKDKFIVGEHTLHFPVPRSLSLHRVYPFPFGPAPQEFAAPSASLLPCTLTILCLER